MAIISMSCTSFSECASVDLRSRDTRPVARPARGERIVRTGRRAAVREGFAGCGRLRAAVAGVGPVSRGQSNRGGPVFGSRTVGMWLRSSIPILFALGWAWAAPAQVDVSVSLSPPVVPFHKPATLELVVESPVTLDVTIPDLRESLGELDVAGTPGHKRELVGEDRVRVTEQYVLEPVDVTDHAISPVRVTWNGGEAVVAIPGLRVRELTEAELAAAQEFQSALPGGPGVETGPGVPTWAIALGVAGILAAAALAVWVWRRRRVLESGLEVGPSPWELARDRLALLAARQLPQQNKFDAYYVDLSAILRYYIEGRFHLHAPERTTQEFLEESLGQGYFTGDQEVFLSRFLRLCDRVKFARFRPDLEETQRSFEQVAAFVEETIPRADSESDTEAPKAA